MEHDEEKEAEHCEALARWGEKYGLAFTNGQAEIFAPTGRCTIDLTATQESHWLVTALYQVAVCGSNNGEKARAAQIRYLLEAEEAK